MKVITRMNKSPHKFPKYHARHFPSPPKEDDGLYIRESHMTKVLEGLEEVSAFLASGRVQGGREKLEKILKYIQVETHYE
jgi:hypothetical protein